MFKNFKIKRLQEKILTRGKHRENIRKIIEELRELQAELEIFLLIHEPYVIEDADLRKPCGNLQKEIADVENVITKAKLMFVRTGKQRGQYRRGKKQIVYALREYLRRGRV